MPCLPLPDSARLPSVVGTPKCQADGEETDAAEAVEDFHAEVSDYMVQLCLAALCLVLTLALLHDLF